MSWGITEQAAHLKKLLGPGLIGTYRSFEVTEILGFQGKGPPTNFLSLLVAEPDEAPSAFAPKPTFLNAKPIPLPSTTWKVGVSQYRVEPQRVIASLHQLRETGVWKLAASPLTVGKVTAVSPQFVPSDSFQPHPWNGVLKNNFFDGSHVLELFDREKTNLRFLFSEPRLLNELAALVRPYVPIGIDGLSDRLGNLIIQLPVTVAVTKFGGNNDGAFTLEPAWNENSPARPSRISWELYEDATVEEFSSANVTGEPAQFPIYSKRMGARYVVWDDANGVILGASAQTAFFGDHVNVTSHTVNPTTREFVKPAASGGQPETIKVLLKDKAQSPVQSALYSNPREPWRSQRIFRDSLHALQSRKEFVQYGGQSDSSRDEALADIRWLLARHGERGAWLWDPYLDAPDLLDTLFYCPWPDADLRALSAGNTAPVVKQAAKSTEGSAAVSRRRFDWNWAVGWLSAYLRRGTADTKPVAPASWKTRQADALEQAKGKGEALKLEFRVRTGGAGWPFHDRFLIFPGASDGAVAWSLGTSINSVGRQHHILQKVSDGELIRQAFLELWNALAAPDYLVWKTP